MAAVVMCIADPDAERAVTARIVAALVALSIYQSDSTAERDLR